MSYTIGKVCNTSVCIKWLFKSSNKSLNTDGALNIIRKVIPMFNTKLGVEGFGNPVKIGFNHLIG